jgi:hypothetical protein
MPRCFCGCGRKVPRFPLFIRSANNLGQDVAERLSWAQAVMDDKLDAEWAAEGQAHLEALRDATHGITHPREVENSALSRWLGYGRQIEVLAIEVGAPGINVWLRKPGAFEGAMGRWIQESGLSTEQAAQELSRRLDADEPLPWITNEVPVVPPYERST